MPEHMRPLAFYARSGGTAFYVSTDWNRFSQVIGKRHVYAVSQFLLRNGLLFAEHDGAISLKRKCIRKQCPESVD